MTNNIRVFLWLGLGLALWINYSQWQMDYGPKPAASTPASVSTDPNTASTPPQLDDTVPQAVQRAEPAATAGGAAPIAAPPADTSAPAAPGKIRVVTDVLVLDISLKGGDLVRDELPGYPMVKGESAPVVLFNEDSPATHYVLQTGLSSAKS
ncbi:MAG TPA: membrane protein insertase YidC, partial [Xanthobacteraceae bacterium]|nr:membrane protein insertase YidC [Xanthobacteraceae bacterium]